MSDVLDIDRICERQVQIAPAAFLLIITRGCFAKPMRTFDDKPRCKLCGSIGPLKRSHVIPKFFLKFTLDDKGRFYYTHIFEDRIERIKRVQQLSIPFVDFDPELLCASCEGRFSKWETYCSKAFYKWKKQQPESIRFIEEETGHYEDVIRIDVDYATFRLFYLSILWRLSASNMEFCQSISLGDHEDEIRTMLLNKEPGREDKYPCILLNVHLGNYDLMDFIDVNTWEDDSGIGMVRLIAGGFCFEWYIRANHYPPVFRNFFLHDDGKLTVLSKDIRQFKDYENLGAIVVKNLEILKDNS